MTTWVFLYGLFACSSELDGKPQATVGDAPATSSSETPVSLEKGDVSLELHSDSKIEWVGRNVKSDHTGGFKDIKGSAVVGKDGKVKAVNADINILSLFSDNKKLTSHLLNEDFFFSSKYTTADGSTGCPIFSPTTASCAIRQGIGVL